MSRTTYKSDKQIRTLAAVGVFSAFAFVCTLLFRFHAQFLTFDLKDAVMAVGAMLFGPQYGLAMAILVPLLEMTISGTGLYGFVMNVIASAVFVCVGSGIYVRRRTMNGALIGLGASVVAMTAVMMGANLILTPFYLRAMGVPGASVGMVAGLIPTLLLPFNLTKALFNAALVFILYKPISGSLRRAGFSAITDTKGEDGPTAANLKEKKAGISPVVAVAAVLAAASLIYFFVSLNGSFTFAEFAKKKEVETTAEETGEEKPEATDSARIAESLFFTAC